MKKLVYGFSVVLIGLMSAHADLIIPTSAIASSSGGGRGPDNLINGVEMNFTGVAGEEGDYTKYTMSPADDTLAKFEGWMDGGHVISDAWAILDLGAISSVDTIAFYNFNPSENDDKNYIERSIKTLDVWVRDDSGFSNTNEDVTVFDSTGWSKITTSELILSQNPGGTTVAANGVWTGEAVSARYVAIDFNSAYSSATEKYGALGEVQVFGTIPEPATISLLGLGVVGIFFARRRLRR